MSERPILLVGSIPLDDTSSVFDAVSETLGDDVEYVPDGEVGERTGWIGWQFARFAALDGLEETGTKERDYQQRPPLRLKDGTDPNTIEFAELGYAAQAISSYASFKKRRDAGNFSPSARFQVCLPTPFAPVYNFVNYESQAAILPIYTAAIGKELAAICAAIPHDDLAIQWDVATEISLFEDVYPSPFGPPWSVLPKLLVELGDDVPVDVKLGYHLCYGSAGNKHWKEPDSLQMCVRVANMLVAKVGRVIDWFHMPVPIDRMDDAYFRPLNGAKLSADTQLFLGLVHDQDGAEGTNRRIDAASQFFPDFGIATECGLGRRSGDDVDRILRLHAECAHQ